MRVVWKVKFLFGRTWNEGLINDHWESTVINTFCYSLQNKYIPYMHNNTLIVMSLRTSYKMSKYLPQCMEYKSPSIGAHATYTYWHKLTIFSVCPLYGYVGTLSRWVAMLYDPGRRCLYSRHTLQPQVINAPFPQTVFLQWPRYHCPHKSCCSDNLWHSQSSRSHGLPSHQNFVLWW